MAAIWTGNSRFLGCSLTLGKRKSQSAWIIPTLWGRRRSTADEDEGSVGIQYGDMETDHSLGAAFKFPQCCIGSGIRVTHTRPSIQTRGAPIPAGVSAVSRSKTRDCNVIHLQDKPGHVMFPNALQHGRITRMRVLAITDEKSRCFKRTFSSCFEQYGRPTIDLLESSSPHGVPRK